MFLMASNYIKYGYKTFVVCPLPNYPQGSVFKAYKNKFIHNEKIKGINVKRLWIFASKSRNKLVRLFSMLSFGICLFGYLMIKKPPKKVIIQCSPLFVGFLAALASKIKQKTIILNVSDLWPLAGLKMGILNKGFYYNLLLKIETYNYKSAHLILGQSNEILDHIKSYFPQKKVFLYRNLPDFKPPELPAKPNSKRIKIVYAGLLGVAQGIFEICKKIEFPDHVTFDIYGDGPEYNAIKSLCENKPQIHCFGLIDRQDLHEVIINYDFALVPLINRIYGSVPSKIFEFSRLGLPVIYFSEVEGANLVSKYNLGYTVKDKNYKALNMLIQDLASGKKTILDKKTIQKTSIDIFNLKKQ